MMSWFSGQPLRTQSLGVLPYPSLISTLPPCLVSKILFVSHSVSLSVIKRWNVRSRVIGSHHILALSAGVIFFPPGDHSRPVHRRKSGDHQDMATRPTTEIETWVPFYVRVICIQMTSTFYGCNLIVLFHGCYQYVSCATRVFHAECCSALARDAPSSDGFLTLASICHEPHRRQFPPRSAPRRQFPSRWGVTSLRSQVVSST